MGDDRSDRNREQEQEPQRAPEAGRRGGYVAAPAYAEEPPDLIAGAGAGLWSGIAAGVLMALVFMLLYAIMGLGLWTPLKIIAVATLGTTALGGGLVQAMIGLMIHMIVSGLIGAFFGLLVGGMLGRGQTGAAVTLGAIYGLVIWFIAQYIILPVTFPVIALSFVPWIYAVSHLAYGASLGALYAGSRPVASEEQ